MLSTIFITAAIIGGTVMICQFALTLLGMGHDSIGHDGLGHDGGGLGGDAHGDVGHVDSAGGHAANGGHAAGHDAHGDGAARGFGDWLFGVLTFRTVVAALAFFGLAGQATLAAGKSEEVALGVGLAAGVAGMYGVYALMRAIGRLQSDGTLRIRASLGGRGSVYIPIPATRQGVGKVQLKVQGRLVELAAMTDHRDRLPTGAQVEVIELVGPRTVLVAPVGAAPAEPLGGPHRASIKDLSAGTDVGA